MSSTEVVSPTSPKSKPTAKQMMEQIVSSNINGVTNGCNLMDNIECINDSNTNGDNNNTNNLDDNDDNEEEEFNEQSLLINNKITTTTTSTVSATAKECHDACMEPLLIQNCVDDDFITNPINDTNCVFNDNLIINDDNDDKKQPSEHDLISYEHETVPLDSGGGVISGGGGGGGFIKSNLSLNLNEILTDELPKNKKFLESSDDQIINQIFFQTITSPITPTTDDDILDSSFLSNDNTPTNEPEDENEDEEEVEEEEEEEDDEDEEEHLESVDFFNRKIEEDETFDTTFTDTADNYQENETNLCSLNENFNENYCSFSSVDYNAENHQQIKQELSQIDAVDEDDSTEPETKCYLYSEQMKNQRPSIVIDCYDSDSSKKDDEEDAEVENNEKMNDYCFYFDQTIEEDDDDIVNDVVYLNGTEQDGDFVKINGIEMGIVEVAYKEEFVEVQTNTEQYEENNEVIETEETYEEEVDEEDDGEEKEEEEEEIDTEEDQPNEDDDKSVGSNDDGVINENCLSVNSAVESFESASTVVKKVVKKSVKKTTTKKNTISTTESSSITSSKAASFENSSVSNGSMDIIEQHHVEEKQQKVSSQQVSITNTNSHDSSTGKGLSTPESPEQLENGIAGTTNGTDKKKTLNGGGSLKKKTKKSKKSDEKENNHISVLNGIKIFNRLSLVANGNPTTSTTVTTNQITINAPVQPMSTIQPTINLRKLNTNYNEDYGCLANNKTNKYKRLIISSTLQLHEDDLSRIDVKSLTIDLKLTNFNLQCPPPTASSPTTKQKEKYSNTIERKLSGASSGSVGYFYISKDISVKHLCRSFGDLTSINNDDYNGNHFHHVYRTKSVSDLRKLEQLPIYTGVSVRNLRDSYCSLINSTEQNNSQYNSNNHYQQSPHSLSTHKRSNIIKCAHKGKVKLGIKQFDMKSSFSKFDALQKKNLQNLQKGGEANGSSNDLEKKCHACTKVVFQMEQIKAEKKFWHRACFKCSVNECNKQLNVDTYQSHEGVLYCKAHFKSLFAPKVVEDSPEPVRPRKMEMIIRENQPMELPADVVRSSDKADLGLEELQQLNVRSRFQVFENASQQESKIEVDRSTNGVKRSTSILSKLARFQAKGMDVGVVDESLNGICYEQSSSEEEEEYDDDENQEDIELIRAKRAQKERPMSFANMNEMKTKFESGHQQCKEERREERKQELQNIRSRLFLGKQARIKEMYQQAVADSEVTITAAGKKTDLDISDNAKFVREKFEKGGFENEDNDSRRTLKDEEMSVFEQGIGKQSRSLFLELDASASKSPSIQQSPSSATINTGRQTTRQNAQMVLSNDSIVRCDSKMDDILVENADIVSKFKFFETYKPDEKEKKKFRITPPRDGVAKLPTPEKELYRDPHLARNDVTATENESMELAEKSHTASKMLSMFRQLEEHKEKRPTGPKPLKCFTPPPDENRRVHPNEDSGPEYSDEDDYDDEEECEEEEEEEEEEELNPNYVKSSLKNVDEFLKAAQSAERAKHLRDKFEKWEKNEIKREMNNSSVSLFEANNDEGQVESAKSLRARFEQMQNDAEPKLPQTRIKVNRFV